VIADLNQTAADAAAAELGENASKGPVNFHTTSALRPEAEIG
jgi:hypothetical protein